MFCLIRMRAVVLDEADLLLTGGYERDAKRILGALREGDRAKQVAVMLRSFRPFRNPDIT